MEIQWRKPTVTKQELPGEVDCRPQSTKSATTLPSLSSELGRKACAKYIVGNAAALLIGLLTAYFALGHLASVGIKILDFMTYYSGSNLITHGHGSQIYNLPLLGHTEVSLAKPAWPAKTVIPYLETPYFALLLAPLGLLAYNLAYLFWLSINCVLLAGSMLLLERYTGLTHKSAVVFRLGAICSLPVFMSLGVGQVSILLLALFTLTFIAARQGHDTLAGVALAFALLKPPYVVPFLLVFLLTRRWTLLGTFAATAALLAALPMIFLGPGIDLAYVRTLLEASAWQGHSAITVQHVFVSPAAYAARWNHSFAGFAELLLPRSASSIATLTALVVALIATARLAWQSHEVDMPLALAMVVALVMSPHTLAYDLALLLLPVAVALHYRGRHTRELCVLLVATYVLITVGYRLVFALPVQLSVPTMIALGAWIYLVPNLKKSFPTSPPELGTAAGVPII